MRKLHHLNHKEAISVFCGWGEGPDVGINIYDADNKVKAMWDFTIDEAKQFAADLQQAIQQAEVLEQSLQSYMEGASDA